MTGAKPTVEVHMPKLGDTVVEGTLVEWLVQPGARIAEGDLLVEITTDKVSTEYPSEIAGTLVEILVAEGETVPVGTPIARLTTEGAQSATESDAPASASPEPGSGGSSTPASAPSGPAAATGTADAGGPVASEASAHSPDRPRATGAARAAATAAGVDPTALAGSGRHGRVRETDVQRDQRPAAQRTAVASPPSAVPASGVGARVGTGAAGGAGGAADGTGTAVAGAAAARPAGGLSPMRRAIAEHMTRAWSGAPHAAVFGQADLTAVVELRGRERARFRARRGADLTALPFFVGALARALGGGDIGVAVALAEGLIVPVVRDADGPWDEVAARVADLVDRARRGALRPDETSGGVSTITNLGVFDAQWSQPILNHGQATILGLGVSAVRPLAQPDGLQLAVTAPLSLIYNRHRLDEVEASALLGRIISELAAPP